MSGEQRRGGDQRRSAGGEQPPRRVAVSGPRRTRTGGYSVRTRPEDIHPRSRLGQVYVRSLVRAQLHLALAVTAALAVVIVGLPAAFALVPELRTAELVGIPLSWLLPGVLAYPVLVGAGWLHVRNAERIERDFRELLMGPEAERGAPRGTGPRHGTGLLREAGPRHDTETPREPPA